MLAYKTNAYFSQQPSFYFKDSLQIKMTMRTQNLLFKIASCCFSLGFQYILTNLYCNILYIVLIVYKRFEDNIDLSQIIRYN